MVLIGIVKNVVIYTLNKPYTHISNIRTFSKDVDPMDLIWHTDNEDRDIEVLEGEGWQFQRDNELPLVLNLLIKLLLSDMRFTVL